MYFFSQSLVKAINLGKVKNNILRIYVFSYKRKSKKHLLANIHEFLIKSKEKTNLYLINASSTYYSLSEEQRILIETIISFDF
jgi:hypothetical protein